MKARHDIGFLYKQSILFIALYCSVVFQSQGDTGIASKETTDTTGSLAGDGARLSCSFVQKKFIDKCEKIVSSSITRNTSELGYSAFAVLIRTDRTEFLSWEKYTADGEWGEGLALACTEDSGINKKCLNAASQYIFQIHGLFKKSVEEANETKSFNKSILNTYRDNLFKSKKKIDELEFQLEKTNKNLKDWKDIALRSPPPPIPSVTIDTSDLSTTGHKREVRQVEKKRDSRGRMLEPSCILVTEHGVGTNTQSATLINKCGTIVDIWGGVMFNGNPVETIPLLSAISNGAAPPRFRLSSAATYTTAPYAFRCCGTYGWVVRAVRAVE